MALLSRQTGPIVVYGATGFTGRLVVSELAQSGADFVVAGRSAEKLEALRRDFGLDVPARPASVDDPVSLRGLLSEAAVVIDCAGPFLKLGEPVLRAAVETSTHYLDTTGEQAYVKMAFERYGPGASQAEIAVIPGMGFDYVPGDMIASLTAEGMGELDEVDISYCWQDFVPSRGTALSLLEILGGEGVEWREREWRRASGSLDRGDFQFPEPIGRQRMIRFPIGEQISVPRHVPTRNVTTTLNASILTGDRLSALAAPVMGISGLAMRTPLKRAAVAVVERRPEGPTPEEREKSRWMIVCEAKRAGEVRRGVISGKDVYGFTAAAITKGAIRVAQSDCDRSGALAPSQAFEPEDFLTGFERFDLHWYLERAPEPVAA
jgi:short subunit dehydrogenase-like uncharacterized protein